MTSAGIAGICFFGNGLQAIRMPEAPERSRQTFAAPA
jgi:hypothetical protein